MDTYTLLRHFADSWMLLAMTLFFLGVVLFAFRPGSRATHEDSGLIPLRNDRLCQRDCASCSCAAPSTLKIGDAA